MDGISVDDLCRGWLVAETGVYPHCCCVSFLGNVRCWGDAEHGALGTGNLKNTGDGKVDIADTVDLGDIGAVAAIGSGPCAITEDGLMKVGGWVGC